ncbi:putatibe phage protein [Weissella oryzae SG25]|uniref:Putatibe phage protein n=1 Tax=Weissella oryzae (strain DSM 25784 / JCM 18191 / LMG 30913 / SG25) TaxID=1329250 RepID=A0A069D3S8_WEIOS|nr:prophage endopeptidase tail family protein [Weissella oryzae]GAK32061.1 putatibe phage protein [Weissella oryzae SG25]
MAIKVVTVKSRDDASEVPLTCIVWNSFQYDEQRNSQRQITFIAEKDGSIGYAMLIKNNIVNFNGQNYVISIRDANYLNGYSSVTITALHIYTEARRIYKYEAIDGTKTYSVNDVLDYYFKDNNLGFTYKVIGDFEGKEIENLGGDSAFDGLDKIVSTWSDAIITHDNREITVNSHDSIVRNFGNQLAYRHNIDNLVLEEDMSTVINMYRVIGAKDDNEKYYFEPHIVRDDESIAKYGEYSGGNLEDERFKDANAMDNYARKQMVSDPTLVITGDMTDVSEFVPKINELLHLSIIEDSISTDIEVVGITVFPFDNAQLPQITLNSLKRTVNDYLNQMINIKSNSNKITSNISGDIQKTLSNGIIWDWRGNDE